MNGEERRITGATTAADLPNMRDLLNRLLGRFDAMEEARREARHADMQWRGSIEGRLAAIEDKLEHLPAVIDAKIGECRSSRIHDTEVAVEWAKEHAAVDSWWTNTRSKVAVAVAVTAGMAGIVFGLIDLLTR